MLPPFPRFTETFHSTVYNAIDPTQPNLSAKGKVVLVTGGSKGIGRSIATAFALAGARAVAILGRTARDLEEATGELLAAAKSSGNETLVRVFIADINDAEAVSNACQTVRRDFGPIDVFVHSAASFHLGTLQVSPVDEYWYSFEITVRGTLNCIQAFLKFGLDHGATSPPTFINVSTIGVAMAAMPGWSCYAISKLSAWSLVDHLRIEMGDKLRVFSIHPGRIATDMAKRAGIPTADDPALPGAFCVWLVARAEADFLQGRLVACNWDADELLQRKEDIIRNDLLRLTLAGWTP